MSRRRINNPIPMECAKCKEQWIQSVPLPMIVEAFCSLLRGIRCPQCGGRKIYFLTGQAWAKAIAKLKPGS
jgi:hypothetical protein